MLKALRSELNAMMAQLPCSRRPALRRSEEEGWLLASDLPQLLEEGIPPAFFTKLKEQGWRWQERNDWLLFDHDLSPESEPCSLPFEAKALCSLLERHPGEASEPEMIRRLARASEQGEAKLELLCLAMHRELAARLRTK